MVLFVIPNTRLALLYVDWQWLVDFKLSVTMTPKFFSSLLLDKTWPFNSYRNSWLPLPMCRTLHLDVLKSICHLLDQSANDVRSCWRLKQSLVETNWKIFVSSANFKTLVRRPSSISLMKTRNNSGPNTEPWGTPDSTHCHPEDLPLILTLCFLSLNHFFYLFWFVDDELFSCSAVGAHIFPVSIQFVLEAVDWRCFNDHDLVQNFTFYPVVL